MFTEANTENMNMMTLILTTLLTHAIFFGEDRYHLVATPAFALLAAGIARRGGATRGGATRGATSDR